MTLVRTFHYGDQAVTFVVNRSVCVSNGIATSVCGCGYQCGTAVGEGGDYKYSYQARHSTIYKVHVFNQILLYMQGEGVGPQAHRYTSIEVRYKSTDRIMLAVIGECTNVLCVDTTQTRKQCCGGTQSVRGQPQAERRATFKPQVIKPSQDPTCHLPNYQSNNK